ncbi:hypothetical protein BCR43DRAFT_497128 [Syncephalastrum racemosum]|uniref:F-box domain-containing protein n=1 Tax=Syncephalastrum racemosum TaxID=13706 RepID=A0A1X2H564_SYNRA|nr:hypothetical protein BCR43DRAFT_497128 [Syncephalastrum racemosum]
MSVDLLQSIPNEVLSIILDLVPEQLLTCMQLSRSWRDFILQTRPAHLTVDLRGKRLNNDAQRCLEQRLRLNPPSLTWLSSAADINEVVSVLDNAGCTKVEKLVIRDYSEYEEEGYDWWDREKNREIMEATLFDPSFIQRWTRITQDLVHLDIVASAYNCDGLLEFILTYTPQLVSLSFRTFADVEAPAFPFDQTLHNPAQTGLRYLRWQGNLAMFEDLDFVSIFFPNLEVLHLLDDTTGDNADIGSEGPCLDDLLDIIQFLPHLVDWSFSNNLLYEPSLEAVTYPTLGLRHFIMEGVFLVDQERVLDIVRQYHETLVDFRYSPDGHSLYDNMGASHLPPVPFPCLKRLHLDDFTVLSLEDLLPHCPVLESLSLARMDTRPKLMDLLHTQPWREVRIDWDENAAKMVERLAKNAIALGARCTLRSLTYEVSPCHETVPVEVLLPSLGQIGTLEKLIINDAACERKAFDRKTCHMRQFAHNAIESGLLSRLQQAWFGCGNRHYSNSMINEFVRGILPERESFDSLDILY